MTANATIENFAEVARGYCSWCEGASLGSDPETQAAGWLSRLYAGALALPELDVESDEGRPNPPQAEAARAEKNLAPFRGWYYREFFDPDPTLADESCMGDVGDDLMDIYRDVRAGLVLFNNGETNDAAWHWRFHHRVHWGRHVVGALVALHCLHVSKHE